MPASAPSDERRTDAAPLPVQPLERLVSYEEERRAAIDAVRRAALLCERVRVALVDEHRQTKQDRSPVTVADFGAQAVISLALLEHFPQDPVIGEEDADDLRRAAPGMREAVLAQVQRSHPDAGPAAILDAIDRCRDVGGPVGRRWVLDPIDGTKGFLRGGQYAVALALLEEGRVVLGVLGCPRLPHSFADPQAGHGSLVFAVREQGAQQEPLAGGSAATVEVAASADPTTAVFCESVEKAHSSHARHARIASLLGVQSPPLRIDSQCKYAAVARGDASIYLRLPRSQSYQEKIWDHAAGWIVVQEAGGRVTDASGAELDFSLGRTLVNNRGVVATNGALHELVGRAIVETA